MTGRQPRREIERKGQCCHPMRESALAKAFMQDQAFFFFMKM